MIPAIIIIIALLLALSLILLLYSSHAKKKKVYHAFERQGYKPQQFADDLWIDPVARKWAIARENVEPFIHDYRDISRVELVEDGEQYEIVKGVIQTHLGGLLWHAVSSYAADHFPNKKKTIRNIRIDIYLKNAVVPIETIVLLNSPKRVQSAGYRRLAEKASQLAYRLEEMKNGEDSPPA